MSTAPVEPTTEPTPPSLAHLSDRELMEKIAHAINVLAEGQAWIVGKVAGAENALLGMLNDPKMRAFMPKFPGLGG